MSRQYYYCRRPGCGMCSQSSPCLVYLVDPPGPAHFSVRVVHFSTGYQPLHTECTWVLRIRGFPPWLMPLRDDEVVAELL